MMKKALILAVTVILTVAIFAGCAGGTDISGKWVLTSTTAGGVTVSGEQLEEIMGETVFTFGKDGTATFTSMGMEASGTYKVSGSSVAIKLDDGTNTTMELDGNKITLEAGGTAMVFEKQ